MQQTTNYNLLIPEGTDIVNPLTQVNPNFQTIDGAMFANKQATIGTASEVVTGTVHAIIRNNADSDVFRFTATGAWTAGDTMTLDGQQVTVHLSDGTTPATNSYIIGAEVLAMVNGSLVTLAISSTPPAQGVTSFNSRTGAVVPAASDYDASMVDYDNTTSGLNSTDVQGAIDELSVLRSGNIKVVWRNPAPTSNFNAGNISFADDGSTYSSYIIAHGDTTEGIMAALAQIDVVNFSGSHNMKDMNYDGGGGVSKIVNKYRAITSASNDGTQTTFTFTDCYVETCVISSGAASTAQNNANCVPKVIYGVR